jgi:hypothetical protein
MEHNWQTIELPEGAKPVHNKVGLFLLFTPEQKKQYEAWTIYQRHDGQFWLYFGGGIKRKVNDVIPGYQILVLKY